MLRGEYDLVKDIPGALFCVKFRIMGSSFFFIPLEGVAVILRSSVLCAVDMFFGGEKL